MFEIGDRVVIQECSVARWIGMTGTVVDPAFGRSGSITKIILEIPFEDDILGLLTTLELYHHKYKLVQSTIPDWEV